jgi:hypothetical protein
MNPVACDSCEARFPVNALTEADHRAIYDQHYYQEFTEELRMLQNVQKYYRRHPEAERRIKPHFARVLESDDPKVKEALWSGIPFDEIGLPPEQFPPEWEDEKADSEVVEYLRYHEFELGRRMEFVLQKVARLKDSVRTVSCPHCQTGRLHVPAESWDEFTAGDAITWYWPDWHGIDSNGALHVKVSGWQGGVHWNGETVINPEESGYDFWRWLITQKEYHRLVEESELPAIREEWRRQTKG